MYESISILSYTRVESSLVYFNSNIRPVAAECLANATGLLDRREAAKTAVEARMSRLVGKDENFTFQATTRSVITHAATSKICWHSMQNKIYLLTLL